MTADRNWEVDASGDDGTTKTVTGVFEIGLTGTSTALASASYTCFAESVEA
jgi:hypothetical protein